MDRNQFQTYMLGIKPLSEMDKFDCREENLKKFLDAFGMKESLMGWRNLFTITVNGAPRHIPTEWGRITVENVSVAMAVVHAANARTTQDSCMSGVCLWESLTGDARNKVTSYANHYTFDGYASGPVLLRAIIACTHIDTRAANERVLRDLENLAAVMVQLNSDIQAFNLYVEGKYRELRARGQTDPAAITHLFQGYEAASDEPFVAWIKRHHDNVDDGTANFTADQLMQMAKRKYADMAKNGTWARPNADQEKIIALTGEVAKIHRAIKKLANKKENQRADNRKNTNTNNNSHQNRVPRPIREEDRWRYVPPDKNAPRTKNKNNKTYHWCPNHADGKGMWTLHAPDNCRNKKGKDGSQKKQEAPKTIELKPKVYFNATTATFDDDDDEGNLQ